jgi:hypothetical protein
LPSVFTGSLNVDALLPAPFDQTGPVLSFGAAPSAFSDAAPDSPGIDIQFVYPDLEVNLPAAPDLLSIATYSFGGINIPSLVEEVPVLNLVSPSIREYVPGAQYTSALLPRFRRLSRIESRMAGLDFRPT